MPFEYNQAGIDRMLREVDVRMDKCGKHAVAVAQKFVPVDSGKLRASISYTYNLSERVLRIHADMPYSAAVEEGTIYMRAQPYLRPALNSIGQFWLGGTQIDYPSAFHKSNKPPNPEVVKFNRSTTDWMHAGHRGSSKHAHVKYRRGASHIGSRWSKTRPNRMVLNHPSPNDATTPIL